MGLLGEQTGSNPSRGTTNGVGGAAMQSGLPGGGPGSRAGTGGAGLPGAGGSGNGNGAPPAGLQITGGAAIVAPVSAFPGGIPTNALIVLPLSPATDDLKAQLTKGPFAVTSDQMWKLLGFNGPAVQVQDDQGRPIAIGLNDLLAGLQKHWDDAPDDLNRGRILAQELLKYGSVDKAEASPLRTARSSARTRRSPSRGVPRLCAMSARRLTRRKGRSDGA